MNITFLGGGNIAFAMMGGMLDQGHDRSSITAVEIDPVARERLKSELGIYATETAAEVAGSADVVILAVKPQQMRAALLPLVSLFKRQIVISVAAGLHLADLSRWLGGYRNLVRAMPNTPALVGAGMTGLYAFESVSEAGRLAAERILSSVGEVLWVESEELLDAVTALSGSGPAYFFHFMDVMIRTGVAMGLSADQARQLAVATATGAARLAAVSPESPEVLRQRVTSKGGTTEAALNAMAEKGVASGIEAGILAASRRSAEMAIQLGSVDGNGVDRAGR